MTEKFNTSITMPLMALRGLVVFPDNVATFDVARKKSIKALKFAMDTNQTLFLVTQKDFYVKNLLLPTFMKWAV